jgi:hypothetical protein
MRLHASRKGFCDRAVEIQCQSVPCFALLIACWSPSASDSPHPVEIGPVITSATLSGQTTSKRSKTERNIGNGHRATSLACGPPSSQANASSTWKSGLIVTSVVRQMNRGRPTPFSMMTKSPGCGIGSRPSRYRANSLPRKGRRFAASWARRHPNRKISPLLSGAYSFSTRSPMDELASRKRVGSNRIIHRSAVSDPGKLS